MKENEGMSKEEIEELLGDGELVVTEATSSEDIITFDANIIAAHEEFSQTDEEEYNLGVKDASRYVGQFHTLINAGINSDTAIVVMSWIREEKLNKDNLSTQLEMAKIADIKIKHETL